MDPRGCGGTAWIPEGAEGLSGSQRMGRGMKWQLAEATLGVAHFAASHLDWVSPTLLQARFCFRYQAFYSYVLTWLYFCKAKL